MAIAQGSDPELRQLAEVLPSTLLQSRADSTTKKYLGAFKRWRLCAMEHKLPVFSAVAHHIVLYMQQCQPGQRRPQRKLLMRLPGFIPWQVSPLLQRTHLLRGIAEDPIQASAKEGANYHRHA